MDYLIKFLEQKLDETERAYLVARKNRDYYRANRLEYTHLRLSTQLNLAIGERRIKYFEEELKA